MVTTRAFFYPLKGADTETTTTCTQSGCHNAEEGEEKKKIKVDRDTNRDTRSMLHWFSGTFLSTAGCHSGSASSQSSGDKSLKGAEKFLQGSGT